MEKNFLKTPLVESLTPLPTARSRFLFHQLSRPDSTMAKPELSFQLDASRKYPFVDSTEEHARLNEQSAALNEAMLGKFSLAPLHKPQKILDVGESDYPGPVFKSLF